MTESPFPFGAAPEAPAPEPDAEPGNRRNAVALGALAAVLLAGGAFFLLGGSDEVVDETAFVQAGARPAVTKTAPPVVKLPVPTKVALGRNPFKALYVPPAAAATSTGAVPVVPVSTIPVGGTAPIVVVGSGSAPTGGAAPAPFPFPVQQPPPQPAPAPPPPAPASAPRPPAPAPAPAPAQEGTVSLTGVNSGGAAPEGRFRYEDRNLTGGQGDVMAGQLLVVSLTQSDDGTWVAVLKLGDGGDFEVREGETVNVR